MHSHTALSSDSFIKLVQSEFDIGELSVETLGVALAEIGFDSLMTLELIALVEDITLADKERLINDFPILATLQDAFSYHLRLSSWLTEHEPPA